MRKWSLMDEVWKRCWNKVFLLVEERREFRTDNNFALFACGLWCIEFVESNALTVHTMYRLYLRTDSLWIVLTSEWKSSVFHAGDVLGVLTLNEFSASIGRVDGPRCLWCHGWTPECKVCWCQSSVKLWASTEKIDGIKKTYCCSCCLPHS